MTVITLSRQLGSHGEEIAARVAQALDLRIIDAETINQAAQRAGVPRVALDELEFEGQRGLANQVLKALRTMPTFSSAGPFQAQVAAGEEDAYRGTSAMTIPFSGLFSPTVPPISASLEGYMRMVGLVIRGLASEGNVLILGRGGQVLLKRHPGVLHLQTVAPRVYRCNVVMKRYGLSQREAQGRVRSSDRARFDYLRRYHGVDWLDSTMYHLIINSERVPVSAAMELIVTAQQALEPPVERDQARD